MEQIRYLHCIIDDKFIDGAISLFESVLPFSNDYVFVKLKLTRKNQLVMVKSDKVRMISEAEFDGIVDNYDVIVLHSLFALSLKMICSIPVKKKVIWFAWGYDLYRKRILDIDVYYPETKKTLRANYSIRDVLLYIRSIIRGGDCYLVDAMKRVDFFSGVFPYEFELLKNRFPFLKAKPLDFYYGSNNFFIPDRPEYTIINQFNNVVIGNSNAPSNNHIDALSYMKHLVVSDPGKVIIPLAYPHNTKYKNKVAKLAANIWGTERVLILDHLIPLDDYMDLVSNCKVAVYFHERQQASDNVLMQLMFGAKVYMSESSLMFQYLKSLGLYIFSLQNDGESINDPLTSEAIIHNRILLSNLFSSTKLMERVRIINDIMVSSLNGEIETA